MSAEFALALVLVVSAGLMAKTLLYMHDIELGFQPDHVVSMRVPLNDVKYNEQRQGDFYSALLERLSVLPGVRCATVSRGLPFYGWAGQGFITEEHSHPSPADMPDANYLAIGPRYFDVLRIPLIKGRVFTEHDNGSSLRVAIVNEALARSQWPGQNAIGKRLKIAWDTASWRTVVGVTGNVRTRGPEAGFSPEIYVPYTQHPCLITPRHLLIRTVGNPLSVVPLVRQAIRDLDSAQPIADVQMLDAIATRPLALRHFLAFLLGSFAVVALLLASIGVYGVMAYSVSQRMGEIGIRIALGASQQQVLRIVLRDGVQLGLLGIGVGLIASLGATRFLSSQLYGVRATDLATFVGVSLLLALVAAMAAYVPARRAAQIDPIQVLRHE